MAQSRQRYIQTMCEKAGRSMRRYGVRCHIIDTVLDAEQRMVAWWFSKQLGIAEQENFDVLENPLAAVLFDVVSTESAHQAAQLTGLQ